MLLSATIDMLKGITGTKQFFKKIEEKYYKILTVTV